MSHTATDINQAAADLTHAFNDADWDRFRNKLAPELVYDDAEEPIRTRDPHQRIASVDVGHRPRRSTARRCRGRDDVSSRVAQHTQEHRRAGHGADRVITVHLRWRPGCSAPDA